MFDPLDFQNVLPFAFLNVPTAYPIKQLVTLHLVKVFRLAFTVGASFYLLDVLIAILSLCLFSDDAGVDLFESSLLAVQNALDSGVSGDLFC